MWSNILRIIAKVIVLFRILVDFLSTINKIQLNLLI